MFNFDKLYLEYKNFIQENSKYSPYVTKDDIKTSTKFPIIVFQQQDDKNTDESTIDRLEYYDAEYLQITIYTQDSYDTSRNVIANELKNLTHIFMGLKKNMKRTACKPIPNLDTSVLRTLMTYQCYYGNVYGNIIRR